MSKNSDDTRKGNEELVVTKRGTYTKDAAITPPKSFGELVSRHISPEGAAAGFTLGATAFYGLRGGRGGAFVTLVSAGSFAVSALAAHYLDKNGMLPSSKVNTAGVKGTVETTQGKASYR